jgi:hypothetical protein
MTSLVRAPLLGARIFFVTVEREDDIQAFSNVIIWATLLNFFTLTLKVIFRGV